jgi:hypothetical protein
MFFHVQNIQKLRMNNIFIFFQTSFFSTKFVPFLLKIEEDFNICD